MTPATAVLLNGSPHPAGNTMALVDALLEGVSCRLRRFDLFFENIRPCTGCGTCARGDVCPVDDSFDQILGALSGADVVIVASPLHFSSLTAPVVAFVSRLQQLWHNDLHRKEMHICRQKGCLAATGGAEYPRMFEPARAVAAAAFKTLRISFEFLITAENTDVLPVSQNKAALEAARSAGRQLFGETFCLTTAPAPG